MMSNQIRPPGFPPVPNNQNVQLNQRNNQNHFTLNQNRGNNINQGPVYQPLVFQPTAYQAPAYQAPAPQTQGVSKRILQPIASTLSSGTFPNNTIANPRSDLKAITTRSGVSYHGPQIPPLTSFLPKVVENKPEATKDTSETPILNSEPVTSPISEHVIAPVSAPKTNPKSLIPYPSRRNDERNREKANNQIEKFYQIFKDMIFEISFANALILMPKLASILKALIGNKEKASRSFDFSSGWSCRRCPCQSRFISLSADFVVVDFDADPRVPLILRRSFLKTERALIDVFEGDLTLRVGKEAITFNLDQTSRYSANYSDMTAKQIDVIDMACEEYS
nr:reverse transcriptase domain-containing protein [Tanacetum cinerariifolium]